MRLGLDLLFLVPDETGGRETYARELIAGMVGLEPDLAMVGFTNREASGRLQRELGDVMRIVSLPVSPRRAAGWALGEVGRLPVAAARAGVDVLHSPANFAPIASPGIRRVITLHDLQYRAVPELLTPARRRGTALMLEPAARRADRIIAVSAVGRDELVGQLGIDPGRIDVIPNGVRISAAPAVPEPVLREQLKLADRHVVLSVGSDLPHKNLPRLIDSIALIPEARRPLLVFCGPGTDRGGLLAHARRIGAAGDVRALGFRAAQDLSGLYGLARCVVLPSRYEGFGLPVLEAMARGVAVACSDIPALREVAGDAAAFFDATSPAAIADTIQRLIENRAWADALAAAGRARVRRFSWTSAAEATLASYRRALADHAGGPRRSPIRPARRSS